jgi:2,5-dihydroxypyridine 5,6-dioxygenase
MAVSDYDLIQAWKQVLTLSKLERGQFVTVLTSASTHPQTLACALLAATDLGAIVNRLDQPRRPRLFRHHAADRKPCRHRRP